ncbi:MAG: 6-hydroxymethylpterin diphosphokinase MptE-like protein, partial [Nitrososphaerales archaeon]
LGEMLEGRALDPRVLADSISGRNVLVIGAGPSLEDALPKIRRLKEFTTIVADGASQALIENGIKPRIVVTDLDGSHEHLLRADRMGAVMVVHAHGDNVNLMRNLVPKLQNCVGSTQVKPLKNVHNFGGFTDGDRAVFLASEFRAKNIVLVGMDFGDKIGRYSKTSVRDEKLKMAKMAAGRELLEWLSSFSPSKLYNASPGTIGGFRNISLEELSSSSY